MRNRLRALALLTGLATSGLVFTPMVQAADIAPVEEPAAGLGWYFSIFGGAKWGEAEVDIKDIHREQPCYERTSSTLICEVSTLVNGVTHDGELDGELDNGFIIGGAIGAQLSEHFRAEIEVSHARLDTETKVEDYADYGGPGQLYEEEDEDELRELFILANLWFGFPMSSRFSPYIGGGIGVAHVDAEFGVDPFQVGIAQNETFSASIEADDWSLAFQLGGGLLIGFSDHVALDIGYRFKAIPSVDLDDPEFCDGECYPPVEDYKADDDFDIHEHVVQVGLTIGF